MKIIYITIVLLGILYIITQLPLVPHKVRDIKLVLIDDSTKAPIGGIEVYYLLSVSDVKNFFGIPIIDPISGYYKKLLTLKSNDRGEVYIKGGYSFLKLYNKFDYEKICINLENRDPKFGDYPNRAERLAYLLNDDHIFTINNNFKGVFLKSDVDLMFKNYDIKKFYRKIDSLYDLKYIDRTKIVDSEDLILKIKMERLH